jgi:hypothetical protein
LQVRDVSKEHDEVSVRPDFLNGFNPESGHALRNKILTEFEIARLHNNRTDRRVALDVMAGLKPHLERMDTDVVQDFCRSAFFGHLKGMATPVPEESQIVLRKFKPQPVRGRLNGNIEKLQNGFQIDGGLEVDIIINGTGHGRINSGFVKSLLDQGLASVNPRLGTLRTDSTGYRLTDSGIAVIGPATHFGIDGMESYAKYCKPCAEEIVHGFLSQQDRIAQPKRALAATAG